MSEARTTFGFHRTECDCEECALNCRFIPGYLIPTDIAAIANHLGYENLLTFALNNLLASPGATVMANGKLFQIPTLVPARQANGACKFLTCDFTQKMARCGSKSWRGSDGNAAIYELERPAERKHSVARGRKRQQKLAER